MNSKECEEQLMRLIYDWETEGSLTKINATDIEAIKHLMLENQMQQDTIKTQKLVINNLSERIKKAIEYMKDFIFEPLLTNEDRKLIMYNDNLRNFEKILKEVE